jgi:hypothetical protein
MLGLKVAIAKMQPRDLMFQYEKACLKAACLITSLYQ